MMDINIVISTKRLKLGKLIASQKGDLEATLDMIAANMQGPDGNYLPITDARAILDNLDLDTLMSDLLPQFTAAMEVVQRDIIPPQSKSKS